MLDSREYLHHFVSYNLDIPVNMIFVFGGCMLKEIVKGIIGMRYFLVYIYFFKLTLSMEMYWWWHRQW